MSAAQASTGESVPAGCELIEVHVGELKQLFHAMDPSPFRQKDLDPDAEAFIVGWARDVPRAAPLALLVHVDGAAGQAEEPAVVRDAIREFFSLRSSLSRRQLRQLFRTGRISLAIGVLFLALLIGVGDLLVATTVGRHVGEVLRESFLIGGWVAMWRPLEIFLYDWWPIRADVRLYQRLSAMPVRIAYAADRKPDLAAELPPPHP